MKATRKSAVLSLVPSTTPRSAGIHVSGIIRAIAIHSGILKTDDIEEMKEPSLADIRNITDPIAIRRICIGLAWEEYYLKLLKGRGINKHPGERCVDNVYMNPDGVGLSRDWDPVRRVMITWVHEVKATYKSTKTVGDLSTQWMWLTQVKAYCKGWGTTHAKLHILHLCGDYKFPIRPEADEWTLEFTQKEIQDNWDMLREYRDYREG